eukprot:14246139-Alexandrium_andersonii.AAC.1
MGVMTRCASLAALGKGPARAPPQAKATTWSADREGQVPGGPPRPKACQTWAGRPRGRVMASESGRRP